MLSPVCAQLGAAVSGGAALAADGVRGPSVRGVSVLARGAAAGAGAEPPGRDHCLHYLRDRWRRKWRCETRARHLLFAELLNALCTHSVVLGRIVAGIEAGEAWLCACA